MQKVIVSDVCGYYRDTLRCRHPESVFQQLQNIEDVLGELEAETVKGWHLQLYRAQRRR